MSGAEDHPFRDHARPLEERVEDLLGRLLIGEKVALLAGSAPFTLAGVPRLDVPAIRVTDGPTGVRSHEGEAATVFPVGVALASTWNPALLGEVAGAIGREALALDNQVVLAPTINIVRTPLWGRNFETYSEDPHLTAALGAAFVRGLQEEGVGASLKHYAANNQEAGRMSVSVEADERTLREIYLAAFEQVVAEADPWTVMASYNRIGGIHATEHAWLLKEVLKGEWAYEGAVVSDWGAVHATAAAIEGGCDLEMPGPPIWFGEKLMAAHEAGEVTTMAIDEAARRIVRLILRSGVLDGKPRPAGELRTRRHREIAARAAAEAIVLLKNDGALLPLDPAALKRVAVVGPNAAVRRIQGGGSSQVRPGRQVSILQAIEALLAGKAEVAHAEGGDNEVLPPVARAAMFSPDSGRGQAGLIVETFAGRDFRAAPVSSGVERIAGKLVSTPFDRAPGLGALRFSGVFWPNRDGVHEIAVRAPGEVRLWLDGEPEIDAASPAIADPSDLGGAAIPVRIARRTLAAGRGVPLILEYLRPEPRMAEGFEFVQFGVRQPRGTIAEAGDLAAGADAAIVVIGAGSRTEGEGYDRPDLELPGDQNALVEAVLAANPATVVVVVGGAPYRLPWADHARAIVVPWLGGEEGPDALARMLFGEADVSGKLPVSWPRRIEDTPAHAHYPGGETVAYAEGLFVGYRHYDRAAEPPRFPFGFGLSYARFSWSDLECPEEARIGAPLAVRFVLCNRGERPGAEVAQLYVRPRGPGLERPVKELKAFAKVTLEPGERRVIELVLGPRAFAFWDPERGGWATEPGAYDLLIGCSAADIELQATVRLV